MTRLTNDYIMHKGGVNEIDARNENIYPTGPDACDVCGVWDEEAIEIDFGTSPYALCICRGCAIKAAMFAIGEA
jgi:hypothetical protein